MRKFYVNVLKRSDVEDLIKYVNSTSNNDEILLENLTDTLLHPSVFKGPYKEINIRKYYILHYNNLSISSDKCEALKRQLQVIMLYLDIKPKPGHTVDLNWYNKYEILISVHLKDEIELKRLLGYDKIDTYQTIINRGIYSIEEGLSIERVITQVVNSYPGRKKKEYIIYFLDRYADRIDMNRIIYFIKENNIKSKGWDEIVANQV